MTSEEFAKLFYNEKQDLLRSFTSGDSETLVSSLIEKMKLEANENEQISSIIDAVLTDAFYTILLGLDGAASIGGLQHDYVITDEKGNKLTGSGAIESSAFDLFHG